MNQPDSNTILTQRYTYATVALVVGLLSFVNLFGFEKSILAVVLGLEHSDGSQPPHSIPDDSGPSRQSRSVSRRSCS